MRKMPAIRINDTQARLTLSLDDNSSAPWIRAAERYAADLLVPGSRLTWQDRFEQAAQRVADEVAAAVSKDGP